MSSGGISIDTEFEKLISGSISALNGSLELTGPNSSTISLQVAGSWSGTLVAEASNDNSSWFTLTILPIGTQLFATAITSNGMYLIASNGYRLVRVRSSAWSSGTANFSGYGSDDTSINFPRATFVGATDGTPIGNIGDRLKVDANLNSGQLVPTITNKLRIRYNIADVSLPNTGVYQTVYSRSGTGLFFGVQLGFDNANVNIRLTIDGGQVFDLPLNDVKLFEFNDTTDGRIQMGGFLTAVGNVLDFSSRYSIPYSSSILIQAATNDSAAHKLKRYMIIQTEDT